MSGLSVLVIDGDAWSGHALAEELAACAVVRSADVATGAAVPAALRAQPDVVVFNHHLSQPGELLACCAITLYAPHALVIGIASAGPGLRTLREWNREHGSLHAVLEKPLRPGQLTEMLGELAQRRGREQELRARADRLANLVPHGAEQALGTGGTREEEMFEAAVLFTDIRRSSELVTSQPAHAFFRVLNESLSAQNAVVRANQGAVVKYTGDGLMALFRGMGRSHLALRCALALADAGRQDPVGFGIGVAEGLVLAGFLGDFDAAGERQQYDVIGSTVHLAARLCARAEPGQVVATREAFAAARLPAPAESLGSCKVRGFPAPVECVALRAAAPGVPTTMRMR